MNDFASERSIIGVMKSIVRGMLHKGDKNMSEDVYTDAEEYLDTVYDKYLFGNISEDEVQRMLCHLRVEDTPYFLKFVLIKLTEFDNSVNSLCERVDDLEWDE